MSNTVHSFLNSFLNFESRLHQTSAQEFSLEPIQHLLERLGRPDQKLKIIHVAGTKGKGSTCAMIASILKEAGYSVGLYTSPHLYQLNERIRILKSAGDVRWTESQRIFSDSITDEEFMGLIQRTQSVIEDVHRSSERGLTFFEVLTALALVHFAEQKVDYIVLETGLGGRLDATNAVKSVAAVITPISLDHQNILGDTIEKIAQEKAGIIKSSNQRVIVAPQVSKAEDVIRQRCISVGVEPIWVKEFVDVETSLKGSHQKINAATAIKTVEALNLNISPRTTRSALRTVFWPGRFEVISQDPTIILDCAHNEDSMRVLLQTLEENYPGRKVCFVLGVSQDKNIAAICQLLQKRAEYVILTAADHPRAHIFTPEDAQKYFPSGCAMISSSAEAVKTAAGRVASNDVVVVTGSVFLVADVRRHYV